MPILDRSALEASPLADLHAIASELSIDGYRRLRRPELIGAILSLQGEDTSAAEAEAQAAQPAAPEVASGGGSATDAPAASRSDEEQPAARRRRARRGGRTRSRREDGEGAAEEPAEAPAEPVDAPVREESDEVVAGIVELLPNGSGFLRVNPPEPSEQDVYVSAAQVKRCELVSGDRIAGPKRAPRRSERFASLVRIDTINDRPASELADSARFDDLPAGFPVERLRLNSEDSTVKAIDGAAPFGRGSRVTICGPAQAGKTQALLRLASALAGQDDLQLLVALTGVRPEELADWNDQREPTATATLSASPDAQAQAVERVIDQGRRLASRGLHAVVLIDTLTGLAPHAARKALSAARRVLDGGSLTVVATAAAPLGGETTVIALDAALAALGRFPAVDLVASWTMRAELLVGESGAQEIVRARVEAVEG